MHQGGARQRLQLPGRKHLEALLDAGIAAAWQACVVQGQPGQVRPADGPQLTHHPGELSCWHMGAALKAQAVAGRLWQLRLQLVCASIWALISCAGDD